MSATFVKTKYPGVYQRGESFYFSYNDGSGRTLKKRGGKTADEARKAKRALEAERDRGVPVVTSNAMFTEWALTEWLPAYQGRRGSVAISERTRREYERELRRWALPWFRKTKLSAVTRPVVKQWLAHLGTQGLAPATVRRIHAPVRAALADAADDGLIPTNPASGVRVLDRAQVVERDDERAKALSRDELAALVKATDPRWQPLMRLLASSGLRISESLALQWRDLDLGPSPQLHVRRAVKKDGHGAASIGPPKSKAGRRTIPLPQSVTGELRRRRLASSFSGDGDLVFPNATGGLMSDENLRRRVLARAAKAAGVPWVGFHTLRHTFGSLLIAEGRTIVQVSKLLGHADPSFTLRVYVHLMDGDVGGPLEIDATLAAAAV